MSKIREFLNIMEGELLPNKGGTLKVELDPYNLYRLLLRLPQPENYSQPNGSGMTGMLSFIDPVSYADTKAKLDKFGIGYTEEDGGTNELWDKEHQHEETFPVSPYPGNNATGNTSAKWDGKTPTAKKPLVNREKKIIK
jgi:hypothetical protein